DLELLDDRSGPAVRDDDGKRVLLARTDVNEVNVHPVDLGDELRQSVQFRLDLSPVVVGGPVAGELLQLVEGNALRPIADGFLVRPAGRGNTTRKIGQRLVRDAHPEWTYDRRIRGRNWGRCRERKLARNRRTEDAGGACDGGRLEQGTSSRRRPV